MLQLLNEALDEVPVLEGGRAGAESADRWAVLFAGGGLAELVAGVGPLDHAVRRIVAQKFAKGLPH